MKLSSACKVQKGKYFFDWGLSVRVIAEGGKDEECSTEGKKGQIFF